MTTVLFVEPELVIALNRKVVFVNPNDLQIFKELELPEDLFQCGLHVMAGNDDADTSEEKQQISKSKQPVEKPIIQHVLLALGGKTLAVTTAGQKALLLYECHDVHAKLISVRSLARASSALTFNHDATRLLVTDKTGDCYEYSCVDLQAAPCLLLGHLSIVYDVLWTADSKYIITCDRDDKIRVTNYPATHDVHGYCLGHKEFVAGLALLRDYVLASVSGDKTLRLWNFEKGEQLCVTELPAPGIRMAVRPLIGGRFQAAVLLHQPNDCVGLYEFGENAEGSWEIIAADTVFSFPAMIVCNLCFAQERLFVAGEVDGRFVFRTAELDGAPAPPDHWMDMVEEQFSGELWQPDDVSEWFKKRYDNVSDYLERKKRRIEEKQK